MVSVYFVACSSLLVVDAIVSLFVRFCLLGGYDCVVLCLLIVLVWLVLCGRVLFVLLLLVA